MNTQFNHDLRLARRKAGLTQDDLAHLLNIRQPTLSDMEQGKQRPNLEQIVSLSLIYGRSFESFFEEVMSERQKYLLERVSTLPDLAQETADTFNRPASLAKLKRRLESSLNHEEA